MQKKIQHIITVAVLLLFVAGCQKMDKPQLGTYPTDSNPPGGPLKFYATFEAPNPVDSIRALYGTATKATQAAGGVSGNALQFTSNGYVSFPSANDFGGSSSFTFSFWMNITLAQKDNAHAVGVMALSNTDAFWSNIVLYIDNNTKSASDSMDLKMHFSDGTGDNWNFAGYNFANAWPKMYDGVWHQVAFTYDASTKVGTVYRDGVQFDKKTGQSIKFNKPGQLVVGGFQQAAGVQGDYAGNSWMAGFPGKIDNIRLYGTALSSTDIQALYTGKK